VGRGERPTVEEYARRYPQLAPVLRLTLPALEAVRASGPDGLPNVAPAVGEQEAVGRLGEYRVVREIGRGGMGVVYEAEQVSLGRRVALKVLPFAAALDARQLARFKNEAQAAAHLQHQNIVPVYGVGCERGVHYYAMQLVEGRSLAALIDELRRRAGPADPEATGPFAPAPAAADTAGPLAGAPSTQRSTRAPAYFRSVAQLGVQAAEALEHAHQLGVIHRDVKPANLMVDGRGNLWITDFGLAQVQSDTRLTLTGDLVGTLRYMSPEQALAQRVGVDHRTDVYSLGATLYELLTLEPVFAGRDRQELLRQIALDEPRLPRRLNRAIPADLETIVLRALEKGPAQRYATAQELADDLERWLKDEPIRARPPSLFVRARKWGRRHPSVAWSAVVGLAVALVAAAASIGWAVGDRAARRATVAVQVRDSLNAARALSAENRLAAAREKVAEARAQLGSYRAALGGLAAEVDAAEAELERFQQFQERIERAQEAETAPLLEAALAADGSRGRAATRPPRWLSGRRPAAAVPFLLEALGRYQILERDDWDSTLEGGLLGKGQVEHIRRRAYAVLLWLADDVLDRQAEHRSGRKLSPQAAAGAALAYLGKAESAHPPTLALYSLRWRCHKALGDEAAARADKQRADRAAPTLAVDHYLRGQAAHDAKQLAQGAQAFEAALRVEPTHYWSLMHLGYCLCDLGQGPEDFVGAARVFTGCILKRPEHAHAYYCRGLAYARLRLYHKAVADYSRAIEFDPKHAEAWDNRGTAYFNLGQWDKAVANFSRAIELSPRSDTAHNNLGAALRGKAQLDEAIAAFRQAIRLNKDLPEAHYNLGNALQDKGKLDEAITAFHEAIRLNEAFPEAHNNLGVALKGKGKVDDAIAAFREAIRLNKDYPEAHDNLGSVLQGKGKLDEAIAEHREAIRLNKDSAEAHNNLGNALHDKGKLDEAIAEHREALRLNKDYAEAHNNLGRALKAKGKVDEAIAEYREAIRLNKALHQAHSNLGNALSEQGKYKEAEAACREAIRLEPGSAYAHNNLGSALSKQGKYKEAEAAYREAIRLKYDYPLAHINLGDALRDNGQVDEAIAAYRKAIQLEPGLRRAHVNLGAILCDRKRDYEGAIVAFQEAIRFNKDDPEAHYNLGVALDAKGKVDDAIAAYRQAIRLNKAYAEAHNNLGVALDAKGKVDDAIAAYRQAIASKKGFAKAHVNLGRLLCDRKRDYEGAIVAFKEAIRLNKDDPEAHNNLGVALNAKGKVDDAIAAHRQAIRLNKAYAEAHYGLGNSLRAKGKVDDAIAAFREAIRLKKDYAEAHCNLGFALRLEGRFTESLRAYQTGHALGSRRKAWGYPSAAWVSRAERLVELDARLAKVLKGEVEPANPVERAELGWLCQQPYKRHNAAAARFYAEAFAAEPKLAQDLRAQHRYNAACAAALAGCGQGKDAERLRPVDRLALRRQALTWLRAELGSWTSRVAAGEVGRSQLARTLTYWQKDTYLAGLRDAEALKALPADERQACRKLWADVAYTLVHARQPTPPKK
jgi:tetratricopeptide (TPR) repeat protein